MNKIFVRRVLKLIAGKIYDRGFKDGVSITKLSLTDKVVSEGAIITRDKKEKQLIMEYRARMEGFRFCPRCGRSTALRYSKNPGGELKGITLIVYRGAEICTDCAHEYLSNEKAVNLNGTARLELVGQRSGV